MSCRSLSLCNFFLPMSMIFFQCRLDQELGLFFIVWHDYHDRERPDHFLVFHVLFCDFSPVWPAVPRRPRPFPLQNLWLDGAEACP